MNKNLFKSFALAAVAVIAGACAKESEQLAGPSNVTFEVSTPEIATKAIGDGMTATKLYYQVFDADGNAIEGLGVQNKDLVSGKTTVSFQLIKDQTYNFIFWAQTAEAGYYIIDEAEGLKKITADYATHKGANDENRDAFFAVEKGLKITGPVSKTIELKRPFAQVNIATKDEMKAGSATAAFDYDGATSAMTIKQVATEFKPLDSKQLDAPANITFEAAAAPGGTIRVNDVDYNYLSVNYVFVPAERSVYDIAATLTLKNGKTVTVNSPATPLQSNYRTNIIGSLFTSSADFNIEIVPGFEGGEEVNLESIKNEASLRALFATGGAATITEDIDISKGLVVPAGKKVVLNLGGKTIRAITAGTKAISVFGELEIDGVGTVDGGEGGNNQALEVVSGAKLVIKNGTFTVGGDASGLGNSCVENYGGSVYIYGGTFRTETAYNGWYYVLNQLNTNPGTIVVYGGTFEKYNPADGDDNLGGNFVADGYKSTKVGDSYIVTKEDVTPVADQAGLDVAMANLTSEPATISLPAGNFTTYGKDVTKGKTLTFNGSGAENTNFIVGKNLGASGEGNSDYSLENSDVTFNDLTITTGDGLSYNYRGFVRAKSLTFVNCTIKERLSYWGGVVKFINCKFEPNTYKKEDGSILPDYNITTYQGTEFSFENCSFKSAGKFMNLYKEQNVPYVVRVKDCTFIATKIDKPVLNMKSYTDVEYKIYFEGTNIAKTEAGVEFPLYGGETASNAEVYVNNTLVWSKGQAF